MYFCECHVIKGQSCVPYNSIIMHCTCKSAELLLIIVINVELFVINYFKISAAPHVRFAMVFFSYISKAINSASIIILKLKEKYISGYIFEREIYIILLINMCNLFLQTI